MKLKPGDKVTKARPYGTSTYAYSSDATERTVPIGTKGVVEKICEQGEGCVFVNWTNGQHTHHGWRELDMRTNIWKGARR